MNYSDPAVQRSLSEVIDKVVLGELPHAGGVLRSLMDLRVAVPLNEIRQDKREKGSLSARLSGLKKFNEDDPWSFLN